MKKVIFVLFIFISLFYFEPSNSKEFEKKSLWIDKKNGILFFYDNGKKFSSDIRKDSNCIILEKDKLENINKVSGRCIFNKYHQKVLVRVSRININGRNKSYNIFFTINSLNDQKMIIGKLTKKKKLSVLSVNKYHLINQNFEEIFVNSKLVSFYDLMKLL